MQPMLASILLAQGLLDGGTMMVIGLVFVLVIGLALFAIIARYFRLWIQSVTTGAGIGIIDLVRMTLRKVNPTVITRSKIMAVQAGLYENEGITTKALEAHYLAGGNVPLVIRSMIAARVAGVPMPESFIASRRSSSSTSLPAVSIAASREASE